MSETINAAVDVKLQLGLVWFIRCEEAFMPRFH